MGDVGVQDLLSVLFDFAEAILRSVSACIRGQDPDLREVYMAADAIDEYVGDITNNNKN